MNTLSTDTGKTASI